MNVVMRDYSITILKFEKSVQLEVYESTWTRMDPGVEIVPDGHRIRETFRDPSQIIPRLKEFFASNSEFDNIEIKISDELNEQNFKSFDQLLFYVEEKLSSFSF